MHVCQTRACHRGQNAAIGAVAGRLAESCATVRGRGVRETNVIACRNPRTGCRVSQLEAELQESARARRLDGQQHRHEVLMLKQQHDYTVESLRKQIQKLEHAQEQRSKE